jgi:outer membrane receptor protein involved in Fe transport
VAALPAAVRYLVSLANPGKTVSAPLDPTYRPEEVNAFEVGAKTQYFNHRARTNIAFYYYDIKAIFRSGSSSVCALRFSMPSRRRTTALKSRTRSR